MEQKKSINLGLFSNLLIILVALSIVISCVGIRIGSEVNLGGDYYYVQDYPQCICLYSNKGEIVLPQSAEGIIVRVQYNDSIILATWASGYDSRDTMLYLIDKEKGIIFQVKNNEITSCRFDNEVHSTNYYKDIRPWYKY